METNFQKIEKSYASKFELAKLYYTILFQLNHIKVTDSELDLITFSALHGTLSTPPVRDEFIKQFNIHKHYMYSMIAKLKNIGIFIKGDDKKVRINPVILPDFSKDSLLLMLKLTANG